MGQKLTLVVTCTDRKSLLPGLELRVGNLEPGTQEDRADEWLSALEAADVRRPLRQLYQGDAWIQAQKLEQSAREAGFDPTLLVASAGLGLVSAEEEWPAYAATFSPRQADSVSTSGADSRTWWRLINADRRSLGEQVSGQTLFVLSQPYATAMADDLTTLEHREDVVIFGGSTHVPDQLRFPADRGLRATLGGTSNTLNLRTAIAWLGSLKDPTLVGHRDHHEWHEWVKQVSRPETYDRTPLNDGAVLDFIHKIRRRHPDITKTRALRALRDGGLACEQKRFGGLFESAVKEPV